MVNRLAFVSAALVAGAVLVWATEAPRRTLVVLGDSLAAGFGVEPREAYPARLQQRIDDAQLPFTVVNAGVSGDTTAGGLRRLDWVLRNPADVLLLELGGNDGLRGLAPESTRSNLVAIIGKARAKNPGCRIVLAGMLMPDNMGEAYNRKFQAIFPEVAQEQLVGLIPFLLAGVGGVPELNQPDRIHPTAKGHELVTSNVWTVLEPVLREAAGIR
jgi:acyl-CoA thioesterase-1